MSDFEEKKPFLSVGTGGVVAIVLPKMGGREATALEKVAQAAHAAAAGNLGGTLLGLDNAAKALKRIASRATPLSEEFEHIDYPQLRGPTISFAGRLLCDTEWTTKGDQPFQIWLAVYATPAGALVAVSQSEIPGSDGYVDSRVAVVKPSGDLSAMHCAVMDHFDWTDRAREMVSQIGWKLEQEVE